MLGAAAAAEKNDNFFSTRIPGPAFCANLRSRNEHEHVTRGFTGKMPDASNTTSIEHQTLTLTVITLSVATLFGENTKTQIPPVWGSTHWFSLCEMIRNHGVFKRLGVCIPSIVYVMDLYAWLLQLPGHVSM